MSDSSVSDGELDSDLDQVGYYRPGGELYILYVETLTDIYFQLEVAPMETIAAIKAKIQQIEGIPVNQQHLLYNNRELPNNQTVYECGIPDEGTLKLVLAMRGGPVNTRKVTLPVEDTAREIQEAVDRSREELLGQIPEGGHVTVLVFRDGDEINLYQVVERPDGSYSPLSDSWTGSSIRNLFAEQDETEVQQRIKENANTMRKLQDIRSRMQSINSTRSKAKVKKGGPEKTGNPNGGPPPPVPLSSPGNLQNKNSREHFQSSNSSCDNLPPIHSASSTSTGSASKSLPLVRAPSSSRNQRLVSSSRPGRRTRGKSGSRYVKDSEEDRMGEITTLTQLPQAAHQKQKFGNPSRSASRLSHDFPKMEKKDKLSSIEFSDTPPLSKRNSTISNAEVHQSQPSNRPQSKLISIDIAEFKKTLDDNKGFKPSLLTRSDSRRRRRRLEAARLLKDGLHAEDDDAKDVEQHQAEQIDSQRDLLTFSQSSMSQIEERLQRSLAEHDMRIALRRNQSILDEDGDIFSLSKNSRSSFRNVANTRIDDISALIQNDPDIADDDYYDLLGDEDEDTYDNQLEQTPREAPPVRGLQRRLIQGRQGRLSRAVVSPTHPPMVSSSLPRVLASPKAALVQPSSPRSSAGSTKSRRAHRRGARAPPDGASRPPAFATRPLSGPKPQPMPGGTEGTGRKKSGHRRPRCQSSACRKKINITNSFTCRCGRMFCSQHRHPETHSCSFDYKTEGRKILEANNPVITIPKLPKI